MIWVGLLILAVLLYSIWAIESHMIGISRQIGGLAELIALTAKHAARAEELLESVAKDTANMPKVSRRDDWE